MLLETLSRGKEPGCLSAWQISQLALGLDLREAQSHREHCKSCAARLQAESKERALAANDRIPALLAARAGTPPWRRRLRLPPVLLAGVAALLGLAVAGRFLALWWQRSPVVPTVLAQVSRDGSLLISGAIPAELGPLRPGDKLRLRVQGPGVGWVRLQAQQNGTLWDVYYEGPLPQDGWLPGTFTVTPVSRMQLRLLACPQEPSTSLAIGASAGCISEELDL